MNNVNKTLYIPLYGKAYVSRKGMILSDKKAEEIWNTEGFPLKGKAKSKWLAYYMGMRSTVFDNWLRQQLAEQQNEQNEQLNLVAAECDAIVIHIGCGMDSRIERVGTNNHDWYDVDFPEVIKERRRYYQENDRYHMIESDARKNEWINHLPKAKTAIIVMEGVSMYFKPEELKKLLTDLKKYFGQVHILMDCYTDFAAKASKYKNPINDVGVTEVYGLDNPRELENDTELHFVKEHDMTPEYLVNELSGVERIIFKNVFAGSFSKKMYRLYEYC